MDKVELRACLVSSRVRLGGAKSASFTEGTATCEPFLRGSILHFRRVSTEHTLLREVLYVPRNVNRLNPHLYKTGSKDSVRIRLFLMLLGLSHAPSHPESLGVWESGLMPGRLL